MGGLKNLLHERYDIDHATIQIESGCCSDQLYCRMPAPEEHDHDHKSSDGISVAS